MNKNHFFSATFFLFLVLNQLSYCFINLKVAIVLLAVVAVVAAESYGYEKAYKPAAYAAPAYNKPAYKEEYAYVRNHSQEIFLVHRRNLINELK